MPKSIKTILVLACKGLAWVSGILIFFLGTCTIMYFDKSPECIEFVKEGILEDFAIGAIIPNSIIDITIDRESYMVQIYDTKPQDLVIGDKYYIYELYRDGWNFRNIISPKPIDMGIFDLKITTGQRDRFYNSLHSKTP